MNKQSSVRLLHLIPSYFKFSRNNDDIKISLVKYEIPELNFHLTEKDLMIRKPFPNKAYHLACRRKGNKGIEGFLIKAAYIPTEFTIIEEWELSSDSMKISATHRINSMVLDNDFPVFSQKPNFLNAMYSNEMGFSLEHRLPEDERENLKNFQRPTMVYSSEEDNTFPDIDTIIYNKEYGIIKYKEETRDYPTIELERYYTHLKNLNSRLPLIEDAFIIK